MFFKFQYSQDKNRVIVIKMAEERPSIKQPSLNAAPYIGRNSFSEDEPCFLLIKQHFRLAR